MNFVRSLVRSAPLLAAISIALAPVAAHSENHELTQSCVNAFVAQHFPGQSPRVVLEKDYSYRSPSTYGAPFELRLSATNSSGNVLVTALCRTKAGVVTLVPDVQSQVIAAR